MTGKQLKNSILQWAIQGKLVPQDPNDEPASVLLEKIRQEKEHLIKEKKIKRDKNASIIFRGEDNSYYEKFLATGEVKCIDEEIPFEVPVTWEWARINAIAISQLGKTLDRGKDIGKEYPYVCSINVYWDGMELSKIKKFKLRDDELCRYRLLKGDLLVCEGGDYGRCCVWDRDEEMYYQNALHRIRFFCGLPPMFYRYVFELYRNMGYIVGQGQTIKHFTYESMKSIMFPVPPIPEQRRIVAKFERILPQVNKYSKVQTCLDNLNGSIQDKLKKSILQEAIQGKFVPQKELEGTAQELLEQIKAEKQKLIKEGKLKKSAFSDSVIFRGDDNKHYEQIGKQCKDITDEIPFDLPDSWTWTRGKTVFMPMESTKPISDFTYIDVDAVNNKLNIIDNPKKIGINKAPSRATRKLHQNDILFSMVRPYLRNIALVNGTYKSAIASTGFYVITPGIGYFHKFLFFMMLSNYVVDGLNTFMKGDNSPSINNGHVENYLYPLPPLQEQRRIVAQIERLFDQLK